jgi:hypothetical protein
MEFPTDFLNTKYPWLESASELYRPSDRHLSSKLMLPFQDIWVPRGQRDGSLRPYSLLSRPVLVLSSSSSIVLTRLSGPHSRSTTSQKILFFFIYNLNQQSEADVVIITISLWGVVQRRISGTSNQVNWSVSRIEHEPLDP